VIDKPSNVTLGVYIKTPSGYVIDMSNNFLQGIKGFHILKPNKILSIYHINIIPKGLIGTF
jgi:hypothetical protein